MAAVGSFQLLISICGDELVSETKKKLNVVIMIPISFYLFIYLYIYLFISLFYFYAIPCIYIASVSMQFH